MGFDGGEETAWLYWERDESGGHGLRWHGFSQHLRDNSPKPGVATSAPAIDGLADGVTDTTVSGKVDRSLSSYGMQTTGMIRTQ